MVEQVSAIYIGALYRRSEVTAKYAKSLLSNHMLRNHASRDRTAETIASRLVMDLPSHDFA